jgi:hypothetical protein
VEIVVAGQGIVFFVLEGAVYSGFVATFRNGEEESHASSGLPVDDCKGK